MEARGAILGMIVCTRADVKSRFLLLSWPKTQRDTNTIGAVGLENAYMWIWDVLMYIYRKVTNHINILPYKPVI